MNGWTLARRLRLQGWAQDPMFKAWPLPEDVKALLDELDRLDESNERLAFCLEQAVEAMERVGTAVAKAAVTR